jgi:hypothetical protein
MSRKPIEDIEREEAIPDRVDIFRATWVEAVLLSLVGGFIAGLLVAPFLIG